MKKIASFLFLTLVSTSIYAQTGRLEGIVTGTDMHEGMVGVNIILEGTVFGTI